MSTCSDLAAFQSFRRPDVLVLAVGLAGEVPAREAHPSEQARAGLVGEAVLRRAGRAECATERVPRVDLDALGPAARAPDDRAQAGGDLRLLAVAHEEAREDGLHVSATSKPRRGEAHRQEALARARDRVAVGAARRA